MAYYFVAQIVRIDVPDDQAAEAVAKALDRHAALSVSSVSGLKGFDLVSTEVVDTDGSTVSTKYHDSAIESPIDTMMESL
ncbi:MAG: hypothetical protein A3J09_00845 [Candidatus Zambryskibacteria bacterium RIFCSPLOWO2_02_FULL_51_21]|uniref:Uncharacterized protein n=1 Tax=Candidatus Zambryskibacteria bacterium RIFCSPHIGHO2_02_FULL_43_37 TaxID=1802749 RepID=A0A1G2THI8_9BACT|nr:MAG: hypothetical protein A2723_00845 [Candidatus Zambryskibacteria bacterium RIFCSPHIGHO2_01_FULL_52_18]OHA96747.1 MAG: hypothetical protein A3D49_02805 [Candidatus Zambryskibacteria bacterium RIFCSPHIGHO2_02_FULL_43_37]OHB07440.1 MAG: hypothetical protein A2944_01875 [Candidatus Zambryskibacteria bacterium RIFCSPLOWO2_01_FULL_52_12]OHB11103.1 MAG: hypothetical protein A3J09_00845 [Candidatus Zambryskibacteria bacterium RIFCSPLOWO2_02_FULL_51_21]